MTTGIKVKTYLTGLGCCAICSEIFCGQGRNSKNKSEIPEGANNSDDSKNKENIEDSVEENCDLKNNIKTCISCLGMLQFGIQDGFIKQLAEKVVAADYDASNFSIVISMPSCIFLRVHLVTLSCKKAFPQLHVQTTSEYISVIKDKWKCHVGPQLAHRINKDFLLGQTSEFLISILASFEENDKECSVLDKLCTDFEIRRKQHRKYSGEVYTRAGVEKALNKLKDQKQLLESCSSMFHIPNDEIKLDQINCSHLSIFLAGRYNKMDRSLPQTKWIIDGQRKMDSSVEELICEFITDAVKPDGIKFSSSGREDVDVRCLGRGRPFVLEFQNPRRVQLSPELLRQLQITVNSSTDKISIRDLQLVTRQEIARLKEGEEEKTKSYTALCLIRNRDCNDDVENRLKGLSVLGELTLHQATPLRVLHRRPLAIRQRMVHSIRAQNISKDFFKLHVNTQAGTYIKEFVHGDFGRTKPNLGELLAVDVDIVALDVEDVALNWPPSINEEN